MKQCWECEKCGMQFDTDIECFEHERECNQFNIFVCNKCEKVTSWYDYDRNAFEKQNQCHRINLGRMRYGSRLDGSDIDFCLCDDCLYDILQTFKISKEILESGSNHGW